jgi:PAS domain S-box-containing protein
VLLLLAAADWIMGYALELASVDLPAKFFWDKLQFIGICIIPTAWLVYTLQYTGREKWLKRRTIALLSIVPLITLLLVFTNEAHGLIWRHVWLDTDGPFSVLDKTYGVGFWGFVMYSYLLLLLVIFLYIQMFIRSRHLYRWQASALLFVVFTPWLVNAVLDLSGLNPFPYLELTPFALGLTVPVVAWSLYRLQLRDIVPVARDTVIESMGDGVMVLDAQNRIVNLNLAAQHLIGCTVSEVTGQPVERVWSDWPGGMERSHDEAEVGKEVVLGQGDEQRIYNVRASSLFDWRSQLVSQVVVLHDITERKRAQEELRESEEKYKTLVEDAPIGIYYSDFNGTFLYGNKKAEEIVGYKREELIGKSYLRLNLIDLKGINKAIKLLAQNMLGRATGPDEFILNRKDGSKRIVEIYTKVIPIGGKQVVVGMVEDITERKRAEEEIRRRNEELANMLETARAVSSTLDLEEVLALIAEQMVKAAGVDGCTLSRWDKEADAVVTWIEHRVQDLEWPDEPGTTYPLKDFPATRAVIETRQPLTVRVSDPDADPAEVAYMQEVGSASLLMLPLAVGDRVIGLAELDQSEYERDFTAAEIRLCQGLADQAAVAIENARLYRESGRRLEELTALLRVGITITSSLDTQEILDTVTREAVRLLKATSAYVCRWDEEQQATTVMAEYCSLGASPRERISDLGVTYAGETLLAELLQQRQPNTLRLSDPHLTPDWREHLEEYDGKSVLFLPLVAWGRTLVYIEVWESRYDRTFAENEVLLGQNLVSQAAVALENARLHAETRRRLKEQAALREAGAVMSSALDLETVLTSIAEQMGRAIDATSAYICSFEPETITSTVLAEYIGPQACPQERVSDLGVTYVESDSEIEIQFLETMQAGKSDISYIDAPDLSESEQAHMQQHGAQTILYIPLQIKGQLLGFAELWESRRRREFTSEEIALCQGIAQQAAIALENARLYEQAQQEITERKRAEEQIKTSLKEKEVLLKEIHHRVKNNLQAIASLLYLQSKKIQSQEALEVFQDSQNRVRSMALVHERLYQSQDLARVDFAEYVRSLANYLFRSYGVHWNVITLRMNVDNASMGIDTAVPCGLILNELVSNCLKHAFPGGREGEIHIELRSDHEGQFTLMVRDDGVGVPKDLDFQNTKSLGLQLVNTLVDQLEGTIELDTSGGTAFEITFTEMG